MWSHCNRVVNNYSQTILPRRYAHYLINNKGEKVVVSKRHHIRTDKEKWQNIRPLEKDPELRKMVKIIQDERLQENACVAKETADAKLKQLQDRLLVSGFCREKKPYNPPEDVNNVISEISIDIFGNANDQNSLSDPKIKFKFLIKCSETLNHEVINSELFRMKTVEDVRKYYLTPVKGSNSYSQLVNNSNVLPKNLHVIPEPIRFDERTDTFFNGLNAFPGSSNELVNLKLKKKFPSSPNNFVWPDV